jgi:hypothetical protein
VGLTALDRFPRTIWSRFLIRHSRQTKKELMAMKGQRIPSFLTHYYEADRGPFKNVCDLSDTEPLKGLRFLAYRSPVCSSPTALCM